jgi:type IV pilus assembly protein PilC
MAKCPRVFSDLWVNLVESGEASGNLAIVLSRLASSLERNEQFRSKIISALLYPAILLAVGLGALIFLTTKIIPTFAALFAGFNMQLPFLTRLLIGASSLIRQYVIFLIIAIAVAVFLIKRYIKIPDGRRRYEKFLFRLPLFGEFFRVLVVERFSSTMSTLIESGVPILYSLEVTERSVNNLVMGEIIRDVKEDVRQGRSLSAPMEKSGFFEAMVVQMVTIGEEVGDLSGMFKKIDSFYQEYVETFLSRFTSMFEPIMILFMGIIIGIMVIGMFLPIFQISQLG